MLINETGHLFQDFDLLAKVFLPKEAFSKRFSNLYFKSPVRNSADFKNIHNKKKSILDSDFKRINSSLPRLTDEQAYTIKYILEKSLDYQIELFYYVELPLFSSFEIALRYFTLDESLKMFSTNKETIRKLERDFFIYDYFKSQNPFLHTKDDFTYLIKSFLKFLNDNKMSLIKTGWPKNKFEDSSWVSGLLADNFPFCFPVKMDSTKMENGYSDEIYWIEYDEKFAEYLRPVKVEELQQTPHIFSKDEYKFIKENRKKFFQLKVKILKNILTFLEGRSKSSENANILKEGLQALIKEFQQDFLEKVFSLELDSPYSQASCEYINKLPVFQLGGFINLLNFLAHIHIETELKNRNREKVLFLMSDSIVYSSIQGTQKLKHNDFFGWKKSISTLKESGVYKYSEEKIEDIFEILFEIMKTEIDMWASIRREVSKHVKCDNKENITGNILSIYVDDEKNKAYCLIPNLGEDNEINLSKKGNYSGDCYQGFFLSEDVQYIFPLFTGGFHDGSNNVVVARAGVRSEATRDFPVDNTVS